MAKKAKYVRIQSQKTIQVTCGLQNKDVTNPAANIPDRLKVSPSWPRCCMVIQAGAHLYPAEIVEWPTVQALAKDKILTIGEFTDEAEEQVADKREALLREMKENDIIKEEAKATKEETVEEVKPKLADIAGE